MRFLSFIGSFFLAAILLAGCGGTASLVSDIPRADDVYYAEKKGKSTASAYQEEERDRSQSKEGDNERADYYDPEEAQHMRWQQKRSRHSYPIRSGWGRSIHTGSSIGIGTGFGRFGGYGSPYMGFGNSFGNSYCDPFMNPYSSYCSSQNWYYGRAMGMNSYYYGPSYGYGGYGSGYNYDPYYQAGRQSLWGGPDYKGPRISGSQPADAGYIWQSEQDGRRAHDRSQPKEKDGKFITPNQRYGNSDQKRFGGTNERRFRDQQRNYRSNNDGGWNNDNNRSFQMNRGGNDSYDTGGGRRSSPSISGGNSGSRSSGGSSGSSSGRRKR